MGYPTIEVLLKMYICVDRDNAVNLNKNSLCQIACFFLLSQSYIICLAIFNNLDEENEYINTISILHLKPMVIGKKINNYLRHLLIIHVLENYDFRHTILSRAKML